MVFWFVAFITAAAVVAVLVSAMRAGQARGLSSVQSDIAVYKDQLAEIDRDLARGVLTEAEADAVRIEVSRRLLAADKAHSDESSAGGAITGVSTVVGGVVLVGGLALYAWQGSPGVGDLPHAQRLADLSARAEQRPTQEAAEAVALAQQPPRPVDEAFQELMTRLRQTVAERPDDIRGFELLARNEANLGNFVAAREAQERLVELKGEDAGASDRLDLVEVMIFAANGYISPEAERVLEQVIAEAPNNIGARYYEGLLHLQTGRPDLAYPIWRRVLEVSDPAAPWVPIVQGELPNIAAAAGVRFTPPITMSGPSAEQMAAADEMSDEDRQAMIEGMVDGLANRLATEGGPPEDWARLIRALGVLGNVETARNIANEAMTTFADDATAIDMITGAMDGLPDE